MVVITCVMRLYMLNWNKNADCCNWDDITCDHVTCDATDIDIHCDIRPNNTFGYLPHLEKFNIAYNHSTDSQFQGDIAKTLPRSKRKQNGVKTSNKWSWKQRWNKKMKNAIAKLDQHSKI